MTVFKEVEIENKYLTVVTGDTSLGFPDATGWETDEDGYLSVRGDSGPIVTMRPGTWLRVYQPGTRHVVWEQADEIAEPEHPGLA